MFAVFFVPDGPLGLGGEVGQITLAVVGILALPVAVAIALLHPAHPAQIPREVGGTPAGTRQSQQDRQAKGLRMAEILVRRELRPSALDGGSRTHAAPTPSSGMLGCEELGDGAAGADAGGDVGEHRHGEHGQRHHGEQLPERRAADPVVAAA